MICSICGEDCHLKRDTKIFELRKQGLPRDEIVRSFGVSDRTVDRILQRGGPSPSVIERHEEAVEYERVEPNPIYQARRPLPPLPVGRVS